MTDIVTLSLLGFMAIYPLCLWITAKPLIHPSFHRFHFTTPVVIACLLVIGLLFQTSFTSMLMSHLITFALLGLVFSGWYWQKSSIPIALVTAYSGYGMMIFLGFINDILIISVGSVLSLMIASFLIAISFFAMNLGHFYLNVHGLSIIYLKRAVYIMLFLLAMRFIWQLIHIFTADIIIRGDRVSLLSWMTTIDGWLMGVAVLFSTLLPLIGMFFALGTLRLKNTQATTGILYALLSAILLGDLACKYYLLVYHINL